MEVPVLDTEESIHLLSELLQIDILENSAESIGTPGTNRDPWGCETLETFSSLSALNASRKNSGFKVTSAH